MNDTVNTAAGDTMRDIPDGIKSDTPNGISSDTRMTVTLGNMEFVLIGTAHVSQESINEVNDIIRQEKPDLICVELDEGRYASITQKDSWEKLNMAKVFKEGKGFLLMANLVLSGFQRRMGAELGVKPGDEMKAALDTAKELNIPHALCDREVQITLRRAWAGCGFWNKSKLLAALVSSAFTTEKLSAKEIEELKNRSELDGMMNELAAFLPTVKETLIDERDQYLAAKIWSSAKELKPVTPEQPSAGTAPSEQPSSGSASPDQAPAGSALTENLSPRRIIAVVGAGHMQGMKNHLEKIAAGECSADVAKLNTIPPPGFMSRAAGWLFPLAIAALLVSGFFVADAEVSLAMFFRWILWNGSLAALGTLLAFGHPVSALVAFLGAPVATINPFIGVGLFAGAVEATLRKPRVSDAQSIIDDVGSLKGFYRNRITRALLVFFLSSIGGMIGNFIAIPALVGLLVK